MNRIRRQPRRAHTQGFSESTHTHGRGQQHFRRGRYCQYRLQRERYKSFRRFFAQSSRALAVIK